VFSFAMCKCKFSSPRIEIELIRTLISKLFNEFKHITIGIERAEVTRTANSNDINPD